MARSSPGPGFRTLQHAEPGPGGPTRRRGGPVSPQPFATWRPTPPTVAGVGMDTHCPTALLLDATGEPLVAGITWDHPGLAEPTAQLIAALEPAHRRLLGNHLMPATAMGAAHRFLQTIEPQAAAAATTFGLAGTWLGQWLTGERAIDPTQASYTGLMASTDGSCRWLADVVAAARDSAAAIAAGATVAERPRPTTGDRGRDSGPSHRAFRC